MGGYVSTDGSSWALTDWQTISGLPSQVYMGLAVTSHDTHGTPSVAEFDQVNIGPINPADCISVNSKPPADALMANLFIKKGTR